MLHGGEADFRSGFVTFVGRPNVGKSSLVNAICGRKISIVSDKPQTTRHRIMGVLTRPGSQLVFVDTPGLHKPVTALGERVNATALDSVGDVDVACLVLDATMPFGKGDRWVADRIDIANAIVIVNKTDVASREQVLRMLTAASELGRNGLLPRVGRQRRRTRSARRRPDRSTSAGPEVLPRRRGLGSARGALGGRAGARATPRRHPRRVAVLDRDAGRGMGMAPHPRRHHRGTRQPEGDGDRQGRARSSSRSGSGRERSFRPVCTSSCG